MSCEGTEKDCGRGLFYFLTKNLLGETGKKPEQTSVITTSNLWKIQTVKLPKRILSFVYILISWVFIRKLGPSCMIQHLLSQVFFVSTYWFMTRIQSWIIQSFYRKKIQHKNLISTLGFHFEFDSIDIIAEHKVFYRLINECDLQQSRLQPINVSHYFSLCLQQVSSFQLLEKKYKNQI